MATLRMWRRTPLLYELRMHGYEDERFFAGVQTADTELPTGERRSRAVFVVETVFVRGAIVVFKRNATTFLLEAILR